LISIANSKTILYRLEGITLSKANSATDPAQSATLSIDVINIDQKVLMTFEIEIIKNDVQLLDRIYRVLILRKSS